MTGIVRVIILAFVLSTTIFLFLAAWGGVINANFLDRFYHNYISIFLASGQDTGPKPEDTLIAPFSTGTMIKTQTDLSKAHRTPAEMADMISTTISEMFTVDPNTYTEHQRSLSDVALAGGIQDFSDFMISSNILPRLQRNGMILNAFVEEKPTLITEGVFEGRYKWVFQIPITVTEMYKDTKSYKDVNKQQLEKSNTRILLKIQIGRTDYKQSQNGAMIERIKISLNK